MTGEEKDRTEEATRIVFGPPSGDHELGQHRPDCKCITKDEYDALLSVVKHSHGLMCVTKWEMVDDLDVHAFVKTIRARTVLAIIPGRDGVPSVQEYDRLADVWTARCRCIA